MHENLLSDTLDLSGTWQFSLGEQAGDIRVPGAWEAQGYDMRRDGPAVYRRDFRVPGEWAGRRIFLQFDAVSYHVEAVIDGEVVGAHRGLWTPFAFDVTHHVAPGTAHELTLTVHKPGEQFPMREALAGFLPDVCTPFGGVWQPARLVAHDGPTLSDIHLTPNADTGALRVQAQAQPLTGPVADLAAVVEVQDESGGILAAHEEPLPPLTAAHPLDMTLAVPGFRCWEPNAPALYSMTLRLVRASRPLAVMKRRFGFRALERRGEQLLFNGSPVCLRGLLSWGWYPDLVCPAPTTDRVREELRRVREMGFNMVKLCLFVPTPAYFDVADEEGMFLWLELPMWLPQVTPTLRAQAPIEYAEILSRVHHHPSVIVYSLGCELDRTVDAALLGQLDDLARKAVSGALVCDNSGSGEAYGGLSFDFADFNDYHFYCDLHEFDPLVDHFRRDWRPPRPWVFGEFCDSDDYRDPEEIAAAHGGALPWWFGFDNPIHAPVREAQRLQAERVARLGWSHQRLQRVARQEAHIVRKIIMEKVRRRAAMGGYVITGLRDTPIATSALFDDLGRAKSPPADVRTFNADTVLALDQGRLRRWFRGGDRPRRRDLFNHTAGEPVSLRMIVSHTGAPLLGASLTWQVRDSEGHIVAGDEVALPGLLEGGRPVEIAAVEFDAPAVSRAQTLTLEGRLEARSRVVTANRWPLWVYPLVDSWPEGLTLYDPAGSLDHYDDLLSAAAPVNDLGGAPPVLVAAGPPPGLEAYLKAGGRALLLQHGPGALAAEPCPFWRESIKLIAAHPVMDALPHEGFADLQFYSLATDWALAPDALVRALPEVEGVTPLLTRLDARLFTTAHYLVEARLGQGRVVASTLRFQGGLGDQPSGLRDNPAGRFLLARLLAYLTASP